MPIGETLLLEVENGIAWLTLNRPRLLNAYNVQMRDELYEALGLIADHPELRVVVFRGAGDRAFCAGADLTEFGTAPSQAIARRVRFERDVWGRFLALRKPLIAAIHGYCLGSGLEIALCCDIRIASADARFGLPETGLGMIPAAAGTQTLPRAIGVSRALYLQLAGQQVNPQAALQMGLVNGVVPSQDLYGAALSTATLLAGLPAAAIGAAKEAVYRGMDVTLVQGLDVELRLALALAAEGRS